MITEHDLPAAREYATGVIEAFLRGDLNGTFFAELIEGVYLDGLAAGREEAVGDFDYGRYVESLDAVAFIRRKVEEGRASVNAKHLGGFLRAVALEQFECFELLAEALDKGEHRAAA